MLTFAASRMMRALKDAAATGQTGEEYFLALAEAALVEAARVVAVNSAPLPAEPFLVVTTPMRSDAVQIVGTGPTQSAIMDRATEYLLSQGSGRVYLVEIKRVLAVE